MKELFCGMTSGIIAYLLNSLLMKQLGEKAIIFFVPLIEESAKSFMAYFIGTNLIVVHIIFGVVEALYDLIYTKNERAGHMAALMSILSHGIFGLLTYYLYLGTGMILLAVAITTLVHSTWNYYITR